MRPLGRATAGRLAEGSGESSEGFSPLMVRTGPDACVDLEAGEREQPQCRICLETDGRDFIAPCRCKGSLKYVHRECLDKWRSIKEGFAFAHCSVCKTPFHLRVQVPADRMWRAIKFRFFVTRDILIISLLTQAIVGLLGYAVYRLDAANGEWFRHKWAFQSQMWFYYICGMAIFFVLLGVLGCLLTCFDARVRSDLAQPCRELCLCCSQGDCHVPGTLCLWTDCSACIEACAASATECSAGLGGLGAEGAPILALVALVCVVLFAIVGVFYSLLVTTMVVQRIWQRHYHIIAKHMLTKEYVVEDLDGEVLPPDWTPPPMPPEHMQQLRSLGLL